MQTLGSRSYVLVLSNGEPTRKFVKVGMVGDTYTWVLSGSTAGQSVVLAEYAETVSSSKSDTSSNLSSLLGGGSGSSFSFPGEVAVPSFRAARPEVGDPPLTADGMTGAGLATEPATVR